MCRDLLRSPKLQDEESGLRSDGLRLCLQCIGDHKAKVECLECAALLCDDCARQHRRAKVTAGHHLKLVEEAPQELPELSRGGRWQIACEECLDGDRAEARCSQCERWLCETCATQHGRARSTAGHELVPVAQSTKARHEPMSSGQRREIMAYLEQLLRQADEAQELDRWIWDALVDMKESEAITTAEITSQLDEVSEMVDGRLTELRASLQEETSARRRSLMEQQQQCQKQLDQLTNLLQLVERTQRSEGDMEALDLIWRLDLRSQSQRLQDTLDGGGNAESETAQDAVRAGWASEAEWEPLSRALGKLGALEETSGVTVSLKTCHGGYFGANEEGTATSSKELGNNEEFELMLNRDGRASLKNRHGKYLGGSSDGSIQFSTHVGPWEIFKIGYNQDDGTVSLRSHHGHFMTTESNGRTLANRRAVGRQERYQLNGWKYRKSRQLRMCARLPVITEYVSDDSNSEASVDKNIVVQPP